MKQYLLVGSLILVLVMAIAGCGNSSSSGPSGNVNSNLQTALQAIDLSDGSDGGGGSASAESLTTGQATTQGTTYLYNNGVFQWWSCYFDQVTTSAQLVSATNNGTTAQATVNFTVTGMYHVVIADSVSSSLPLNKSFSVSGQGTVYFTLNGSQWQVTSFTSAPLVSNPTYSPTMTNVSFNVTPAEKISITQSQTTPFVSQATVNCASMPGGYTPLILFIATRNLAINWGTTGRRQFVNPQVPSSFPYTYTANLPLRTSPPIIRVSAAGSPHFGGIFACELYSNGGAAGQASSYGMYLTIFPGMILVTP